MKALEDISESLNSLSQVISMSFMFAKSSPMKAKRSLTSCAAYLQSKTFKSTSFLIRFFLVLIDLLKNEHVEILVLTVLSMLKQFIDLLKSKEVQIIITQMLVLTTSKPVTNLINCITKCAQSLFYIIKTDEIAKFQKQIWELIQDETAKEQDINHHIIHEGYHNQQETSQTSNDNVVNDEIDSDNDDNISYYSPTRAWYGLTSMFGANNHNQEGDILQQVQQENECDNNMDCKYDEYDTIQRSKSVSCTTQLQIKNNSNRSMKSESRHSLHSESVGINDWVYLIHFIDELEDNGDISIHEGDELRKLAMNEKMTLLIIYRCYENKPLRFIRYAKDILKDAKELKLLKTLQIKSTNSVCHQNINALQQNDSDSDEIVCID